VITVSGSAVDWDGRVTNVTLLVNGLPYASTNSAGWTNFTTDAFSFAWSTNVPGWYTFVAVASDNSGLTTASDAVSIGLTNGASVPLTASISNLPMSMNLVAQYPVVRDGFFHLYGQAEYNSTNTDATLAFQLMLYRPQDNEDAGLEDTTIPYLNVTPGARDASGFHFGGDTNWDLGLLDFTGIPNGTYDLQLTVRAKGAVTNVVARFRLDAQLKVGQFSFSESDVAVPVMGIPLTVTRTYNSMNPQSADFGYGWTYALSSMDVELDEQRTQPMAIGSDQLPFGDDDATDYGPVKQVTVRTGGSRDVTLTLPDGRRTTFAFTPRYDSVNYRKSAE
jgi:hypothetical protein